MDSAIVCKEARDKRELQHRLSCQTSECNLEVEGSYLGPSKISPVAKATGGKSHGTHSMKVGEPPPEVCQLSPGRESSASEVSTPLMHDPVTSQQYSLQALLSVLKFSTISDHHLQSHVKRIVEANDCTNDY